MNNDEMMDSSVADWPSTVPNLSQSCQICGEAVDDDGKDGLCEICRLLNEQLLLSATSQKNTTTAPHKTGVDGNAKFASRRGPGRQRGLPVKPILSQTGLDRLFEVGFSQASKQKLGSPQPQSQYLSGMNLQTMDPFFHPSMLVDPDVFNPWNSTSGETEPGPWQVGNGHKSAPGLQKPLEPSGAVGSVVSVDWASTPFFGQYFDDNGTNMTHIRNRTTGVVTGASILDAIMWDVDRAKLRAELGMDLGVPRPKIDYTTYAWHLAHPPSDAYYDSPPQPPPPPPPPSGY